MKNKKRLAIGAGVMSGCLVLAGTFAWFSTTDKVKNEFQMDSFDVTITEDFDKNPDVPLIPGADITKSVTVTNSGNMDVLVRVQLEEMLKLLERDTTDGVNKLKITYKGSTVGEEYEVPVKVSEELIAAYEAQYTDDTFVSISYDELEGITVLRKVTTTGDNTVYSYFAYVTETKQLVKVTPQGDNKETPDSFTVEYAFNNYKNNNADGVTTTHDEDGTLDTYYGGTFHEAVTLNFAADVDTDNNGEIADGAKWYLGTDNYFYYTETLKGGSISAPLLESVSINEEAGDALQGAYYALTPIMEAVQVERAAVDSEWAGYESDTTVKGIIEGLTPEA